MPTPNLTIPDVARRYNLSHWTVRLHLKQGLLPGYRVGGQWRFDAAELDTLDAARHQPGRATRLPEVQP
ncbi:MAG: DNA-binding protein [Candidatus Latescibacteria bacterium]|nr:DNA-binding protein [Candidatus Latescibacterota bacterium]